jgi:hypothetical protein
MNVAIMEFMMHTKELLKPWCPRLMLNRLTLKLSPLVMEVIIMLIPSFHVVHDHTSSHHLSYSLNAPYSRRWCTIAHQGTPNILSTSFLQVSCCLVNLFFLFFWCTYCLQNCGPVRIDAISWILGLIVCIPIDLIVNHWIIAFYKSGEHWSALENVHVNVGTCHAEERVPNP